MTYISSDTNVWIDFLLIDSMELPFRLPYTFIMSEEAIEDEFCLRKLQVKNGKGIRLPEAEIRSRLQKITDN